jgi:hypothetical protein
MGAVGLAVIGVGMYYLVSSSEETEKPATTFSHEELNEKTSSVRENFKNYKG